LIRASGASVNRSPIFCCQESSAVLASIPYVSLKNR